MTIRPFQISDEPRMVELWRRCNLIRPQNDPSKDIARKLKIQPEMFLVATEGDQLIGSVMCGYDGHRGWINYVAVDPEQRLKGIGRALIAEAERILRTLGCPKINLQVRKGSEGVLAFYRAIGFVQDEVLSMGKRLEKD